MKLIDNRSYKVLVIFISYIPKQIKQLYRSWTKTLGNITAVQHVNFQQFNYFIYNFVDNVNRDYQQCRFQYPPSPIATWN